MSWAHYILQVNIYLVVFYGFYKLLLDKETYFILNRIYLLSAGFLSLIIPILRFEWFTTQPVAQPVYTGVDQLNEMMAQVVVLEETPDRLNTSEIVVLLYLIGVLFFIVRFLFQLYKVRLLLKVSTSGTAFSFFSKKIIDKDLPGVQIIEKHEEVHIRQWHTLDILFFEVLGILNWFNPAIYFYKRTVKNIHEYLADEAAANYQGDKEQYALLLLSTAFGVKPNHLTNSFFNKSLIKKRIYMLHKQRSKRAAVLKYGLFVPLFAMTLILSSATIRNNKEIQSLTDNLPLNEPLATVKDIIDEAVVTTVSLPAPKVKVQEIVKNQLKLDTPASTSSRIDWKSFYTFITRKIKYPAQARESNLQGNAYVKFTIKNGHIEDLGITGKPLGGGCDSEAMSTILAYTDFKETADGKYILPFNFRLQNSRAVVHNEMPVSLTDHKVLNKVVVMALSNPTTAPAENSDSNNDDTVYSFVSIETQPSFPGGMKGFYDYLTKNVKYPKEALENKVKGSVYLSYVVEIDGSLTNIKVDRKLGSGTDEEAVRVLKESPKWTPVFKMANR
jgi:outer membrane biosynthesis protein TonB